MEIQPLDEEEMQMIYNWVDEIPLSRPKRNIARDFSDGGKIFSISSQFKFYIKISKKDKFHSACGRGCETFLPSLGGDSQLQCSSFSFSKDLQLEHLESEGFQEDWFYYYKERH
jgi:hypothetical protein